MLTYEEKKELHKWEFTRFDDSKARNAQALDKILFVIGTGSFVLSISYVSGFSTSYLPPWLIFLLIGSWLALAISIAIQAYSYRVSLNHDDYVLKGLNKWRAKGLVGDLPGPDEKTNKMSELVDKLNIATAVALAIGLLTLLVFAAANLLVTNKERKIERESNIIPQMNVKLLE